ncbi:MAG: hypothetical protein JOZ10_17820 [Acidobacteria bacterium]|nr:hypothetical protein [Acidobacteriota bacterium]
MRSHLALAFLLSTMLAHAQPQRCVQSEFSGEAAQGQRFTQELGEGLVFSVVPMWNAPWGWFKIRVRDESRGSIFVFNPSDDNWLLATPDWWSTFIGGGFQSDQNAALQYRLRSLVFPLSADAKEKLKEFTGLLSAAKTSEEERDAFVALNLIHLGQITFSIEDYRFANGDPPKSVEWVKFTARVTVPAEFTLSEKLVSAKPSLRYVDCPPIPDEVIENFRHPKRHEYFLTQQTATPAAQ